MRRIKGEKGVVKKQSEKAQGNQMQGERDRMLYTTMHDCDEINSAFNLLLVLHNLWWTLVGWLSIDWLLSVDWLRRNVVLLLLVGSANNDGGLSSIVTTTTKAPNKSNDACDEAHRSDHCASNGTSPVGAGGAAITHPGITTRITTRTCLDAPTRVLTPIAINIISA